MRLKYKSLLLFLGIISFSFISLNAQNKYIDSADSDKDAVEILEKTKTILNNSETLIFDYSLTTKAPESLPSVINGIAKQKGNKYYLELGDQNIYCDGTSVKIYFITKNEVQINDLDEDAGMITPTTLLNSYDTENYIFALGENKKKFFKLIFKPISKYSEYSKIETLIDNVTFLPSEIKMFYKDGIKHILKINSVQMNQKIENNVFIFNKADHPDVSVEDLRMN